MLKIKQRIIALILVFSLICGSELMVLAETNNVSDTESTKGVYGTNCEWEYDSSTSTLTITGEGEMAKTESGSKTPWYQYANELKHIVINDGITSIPRYVFEYQTSVETVRLPKTLETLACSAFNDCENLNNLLIPYSVKKFIQEFSRCGLFTDLYYEGTEEEWAMIEGIENVKGSFGGPKFNFHYLELHEKIDSTCTEDGIEAYYSFGDGSVYSQIYDIDKHIIEVPNVIKSIGHTYGEWITDTEAICKENGSKHKKCNICGDVVTEEIEALGHFYDDGVITTEPTTSSEGIKTYTCSVCGETKEETIPVLEDNSTIANGMCGDNLAWQLTEDGILTISGTGEMYDFEVKNDNVLTSTIPWAAYVKDVKSLVIESGVTHIGDVAFWEFENLSGELILPETLKSIGDRAFVYCDFTGELKIPESVNEIGAAAFGGCSGFSGDVVIPEGVSIINNGTFDGCSGFDGKLSIPNTVREIDVCAFAGCTNLNGDLLIPDGVESIGECAFESCRGFTGELILSNTIKKIGYWAFDGCNNINKTFVYNKDCTIEIDFGNTLPPKSIIYGYADSTAYEYAKDLEKEFRCIEHNWNDEYSIDKEATCAEEGSKSIHCSSCSEIKDVTTIPMVEHTYDDGIITTEPTTATEGIKVYTCTECGAIKEEIIPILDKVASMSVDKILLSEGESVTITIEMNDGYEAKTLYLYKPITKNTVSVSLHENADGSYSGTFTVNNQTESGIWQVSYLSCVEKENDTISNYKYIYNSKTYAGTTRETIDFSEIEFEVIGTNADVTPPVLVDYSIDKVLVSSNENVNISISIQEETPKSSITIWYVSPSGSSEYINLKKKEDSTTYIGSFKIDEETELGVWKPRRIALYDSNNNDGTIYNSAMVSSGTNKRDLSNLNFEVISQEVEDSTDEQEYYIVIFKDGFGNTLSTQRVKKGDSAIEPSEPTNELYLFNGWDTDFSNISNNTIVTAKWILNPNVEYDKEAHIGSSFEIDVYSPTNQTCTISCNEDVGFTSNLSGSSIIFNGGQMYYHKSYEILVDEPGSYIFYAKGNLSTNTLTFLVRITDHEYETSIVKPTCEEKGYTLYSCNLCDDTYKDNFVDSIGHSWSDEYTTDIAESCEGYGSKSIHCSNCIATKDVVTIEPLGHSFKDYFSDGNAICEEDGTKTAKCERCNKTDTIKDDGSATGHIEENVEALAPTCTEAGLTEGKRCSVCGEFLVAQEEIPATGHSYGSYKTTVKASFGKKGKQVATCSSCGKTKSRTIASVKTPTLSTTTYTFNNKVKKPTVTVKDTNGNKVSYSVSYASGRKNVGKYTVKVTLKGTKYSGTKTVYFKINPKGVSISSLSKATKAFTVKWKKPSSTYRKQMTGYQIRYSTSSKMKSAKTVTVKSTTATSKKISKLKAKKTYYVQMRTYKTVNGVKYYSGWSTTKKVKTK